MYDLGRLNKDKGRFLSSFYWFQLSSYYGDPKGYEHVDEMFVDWIDLDEPPFEGSIHGVSPCEYESAKKLFALNAGQIEVSKEMFDEFLPLAMMNESEIMGLFIGHFFEDAMHDDANAIVGYRLAAQNGSLIGMKCYADKLVDGRGCDQDEEKAMEWYRLAAERGEPNSCYALGEYYQESNPYLAAYWYDLANRRGVTTGFDRIMEMI